MDRMGRGGRGRSACVPHDGAEALAGDGVPALVVRDGVALVGGAAVRAAAAHRRRLRRWSPRQSSPCASCGCDCCVCVWWIWLLLLLFRGLVGHISFGPGPREGRWAKYRLLEWANQA